MSSTACCISFISFSLFSSIFSFSLTGTLSVSWTLLSASFTSSCSCRWGLSSYLWRRYLRKKLFSFNKLLSYEMTVVTLLCYSFEVLGKQLNHKYFSKWKLCTSYEFPGSPCKLIFIWMDIFFLFCPWLHLQNRFLGINGMSFFPVTATYKC